LQNALQALVVYLKKVRNPNIKAEKVNLGDDYATSTDLAEIIDVALLKASIVIGESVTELLLNPNKCHIKESVSLLSTFRVCFFCLKFFLVYSSFNKYICFF
jgi:hypothetical protein